MTPEEMRQEITMRIERETKYVLAWVSIGDPSARAFLEKKMKENDKTLKIMCEYLASKGDDWETFYKANHWDKT